MITMKKKGLQLAPLRPRLARPAPLPCSGPAGPQHAARGGRRGSRGRDRCPGARAGRSRASSSPAALVGPRGDFRMREAEIWTFQFSNEHGAHFFVRKKRTYRTEKRKRK